jgi:methylenetetrahydrofolate reductase (NADPH)
MDKIADIIAAACKSGRPTLSFEFFPPKTTEAQTMLSATLRDLQKLLPSFVSVTYGAGGGTRELTHQVVVDIATTTSLTPMAHLSCVGHTRGDINTIIDRYTEAGIVNFLALGGDAPRADVASDVVRGDFTYASELVDLLKTREGLSIGVAAHPESHPRSVSVASDRQWLASKLRKADFAVTQFFFDADRYFELIADLAALGIDKPIIPGIMPITNAGQIVRMAQLSGAAVPTRVIQELAACGDDAEAVSQYGVQQATQLAQTLLDGGAPGIHLYTLNRSTSAHRVATSLGLA